MIDEETFVVMFMTKPKKVRIQFDAEILGFYKNDGIVGFDSKTEFNKTMLEKILEYKNRIADTKVGEHISYFYNQLKSYTDGLNCIILDKAVNRFEEYLKKNTGQKYKITLVVEGNL